MPAAMKRSLLLGPALLTILVACASDPPPPPAPPPAPTTNSMVTAPPAPPAEPTAEEKKKADDKAKLEKDRVKMKADLETETARWTPEMKTEAKALEDKSFGSGKDAIKAAQMAKFRKPENAARDKYRHPVETMDFFGFKPGMTVIDYGPGDGWYTELLAPATAKKGKYIATSGDAHGPEDSRGTFMAQKWAGFLATSPELYGKVETITTDGKNPGLPNEDGKADMIVAFRELHGMVNAGTLDGWLAAFNTALKTGGILGIEEHRAPADSNPTEMSKKGYLPEKFVIEKIEAAGFKLAGKSEINANKADTKDYPDGVWTLPPSLQKGETDKAKYQAIGESDRMTLKFTKVAKKADAMPMKPGTMAAPTMTPKKP